MSVLDTNFGKFESKHETSSGTAWTQNAFAEIMSDKLYSASSPKTTDAAWLGNLVLEDNTANVAKAPVEGTAATAEKHAAQNDGTSRGTGSYSKRTEGGPIGIPDAATESPFKFTESVHPRQSDVAEKAAAQIPRRGTQIDEKLLAKIRLSFLQRKNSRRPRLMK